jgi:hypothetical protein
MASLFSGTSLTGMVQECLRTSETVAMASVETGQPDEQDSGGHLTDGPDAEDALAQALPQASV